MSKTDNERNLDNIRSIDPHANEILEHCNHAALFEFSSSENKWLKTRTDGPLFIYKRLEEPLYSLMIANRQSLHDFIEPITGDMTLKFEPPYIFVHRADGHIRGVWVYGEDDCKRVYTTMLMLRDVQRNQQLQQTNKGTPILSRTFSPETVVTDENTSQREKPPTSLSDAEQTKNGSQQQKSMISLSETEPLTPSPETEQMKLLIEAERTLNALQPEKPQISSQKEKPLISPSETEQTKGTPQREKLFSLSPSPYLDITASLSSPPFQTSDSLLRPVTYSDLLRMKQEMNGDLLRMKQELNGDLLRVKQELKQELTDGFKEEMKQMMDTFKEQMMNMFKEQMMGTVKEQVMDTSNAMIAKQMMDMVKPMIAEQMADTFKAMIAKQMTDMVKPMIAVAEQMADTFKAMIASVGSQSIQ